MLGVKDSFKRRLFLDKTRKIENIWKGTNFLSVCDSMLLILCIPKILLSGYILGTNDRYEYGECSFE